MKPYRGLFAASFGAASVFRVALTAPALKRGTGGFNLSLAALGSCTIGGFGASGLIDLTGSFGFESLYREGFNRLDSDSVKESGICPLEGATF